MMLRKLTILLVIPLLSGCLLSGAGTSIKGKVNFDRLPATGVSVEAYRADAVHLSEHPAFRSDATAADGTFRLDLPPGSYYLFARGPGLFAYYGRNPVLVPDGGLEGVSIGMVQASYREGVVDALDDVVSGQVTNSGAPQAEAIIFVYTDLTTQLKGMGYMMAGPTDDQGRFELNLPSLSKLSASISPSTSRINF